jgi:hypothetical protein
MVFSRMKSRRIAVIVSLMLFTAHIALSQTPNAARSRCPMTPAPQTPFTPTGANPQRGSGPFFFGTPKLSVLLTHSWTVHQPSVRWFSDDVPVPRPINLKITGRRLDPDVAAVVAQNQNLPDSGPKFFDGPSVATRGNLILSGLDFPSPGCWEITARLNDTELRFVTYVAPIQKF